MKILFLSLLTLLLPASSLASGAGGEALDLTGETIGILALILFSLAYLLVMTEEFTHLRKSKPVLLVAGVIWAMIAAYYASTVGTPESAKMVEEAIRHNFLEFSELMLFLLVAMTYINAMEERRVFEALRSWLIRKGFGFRQLFWLTGILAFFISPVADNLTTALLMCAVVLAVGGSNDKFVLLGCINIVVAANAGGAFSPFGDITTLMVWQKGIVEFSTFFALFIPSAVNFIVPAAIMHFAVPDINPDASNELITMKRGARRIIVLFLLTIATAVSFHNFLHLPPVIGMMTGLSYLQFFGYFLKKTHNQEVVDSGEHGDRLDPILPFDIFNKVARAEWDTLLFFYGVVLAVGGLGFMGYLSMVSEIMYTQWGATMANITVGGLSAIFDNIPVMFAVLSRIKIKKKKK